MPTIVYFETREESRLYCAAHGIPQRQVQKNRPGAWKRHTWYLEVKA